MTEKIIPDGYKLVAVKGLDELVYWLERCKDKGHLEDCADLIEPFEAFEYRNVSEESVIAAHEAKAAPAVPQGWKLVPVEPTREMLDAYLNLNARFHSARADWAAMLAAAPAPARECGNCFEGKSDMDHDCQKCGGTGFLPTTPAAPSQPAVPQGTNWHAHHVIVGKAALQMVRNALRNDMERGLIVRGEMLEELDKVTYSAPPAAPSQEPVTLTDEPPQKFVEWLEREMPPETVILNASWWATRIYGAIIAALREKDGRA